MQQNTPFNAIVFHLGDETTVVISVFRQYLPPVESRAASGFVGLKNGGATCYMNAVFQQLYMQPGLAEVRRTSVAITSCRHQGAGHQVISVSKCGFISGLPLH